MTIYEQLINGVENGLTFRINFIKRSLKLGNKYLVKDGKYDGEYGFIPKIAKNHIEELYKDFYYSTPSERSDSTPSYFYSKPSKDMSEEELIIGSNRYLAQAKLEGYVLGLILSNCPWENFTDKEHYFWKSENNKHLIMFRDWFTKE